uniref:FGGY_N domain-containing protein n=1 Tax=Parastrongyloides trichosuri TaxID=131310 RepID=A0A0N5A2Q7_PARTI
MNIGIDVGTTSIKVVVIDIKNKKSTSISRNHDSTISNLPSPYHEQDPKKIIETIVSLLNDINQFINEGDVMSIRICGQMHGIMLWDSNISRDLEICSNLITWMDGRCDDNFIKNIYSGNYIVSKGFGFVSLLWLVKNNFNYVKSFNRCGTIMDFVCCYLSNDFNNVSVTDQNAYSWGFFNRDKNEFDKEILTKLFPVSFFDNIIKLPSVTSSDKMIGVTRNSIKNIGLKENIKIMASLGDLQASLSVTKLNTSTAFIIIGTSGQISFILKDDDKVIEKLKNNKKIMRNIFIQNYSAWTGALMNGGNSLSSVVKLICNLYSQLVSKKENINEDEMWDKLLNINPNIQEVLKNKLSVDQLFIPERAEKAKNNIKGLIISGLMEDTGIDEIFPAIAYKIIHNMHEIISSSLLASLGISRIILIGKGTTPLFKSFIEHFYNNQHIVDTNNDTFGNIYLDAAFGSSIYDYNILNH